jgi:two-component system sensor histidine kinase/response regulator
MPTPFNTSQPLPPRGTAADLPCLLGPGGRPWLALLADDNAINREVGAAMLQGLGLQVHTARDGQEALGKVAALAYDVVLMDMQMPHLDGLAATRAIRQLAHGGSLPVIAMTANAFEQNRADCLAAGMNAFVTKPVDIRQLAQALQHCLPG